MRISATLHHVQIIAWNVKIQIDWLGRNLNEKLSLFANITASSAQNTARCVKTPIAVSSIPRKPTDRLLAPQRFCFGVDVPTVIYQLAFYFLPSP